MELDEGKRGGRYNERKNRRNKKVSKKQLPVGVIKPTLPLTYKQALKFAEHVVTVHTNTAQETTLQIPRSFVHPSFFDRTPTSILLKSFKKFLSFSISIYSVHLLTPDIKK